MEQFSDKIIKGIQADSLCGIKPDCQVESCGPDLYHIEYTYELNQAGSQDDCAVCISAPENPLFVWSPHLTPEEGYIVQQHVFRTPAMIFRYEVKTLIVFPDIETMKKQSVPWYMDLDAPNGKLYIGMSKSQIPQHVLFTKAPGAVYPAGKTTISFYMIIKDEAMENPFRPVLEFYWSRYGKTDALKAAPAKKALAPYVKHTYDWAFKRWKNIVWQEFHLNGKDVGAPVFIVNVTQSPNYTGVVRERELRSIWNQAWFCSLRSASGLYRYAKRTNNEEYLTYANKTKELALAFPQNDGLFDSVIATEMEQFEAEGRTYMRSKGWDTRYFGNSDRNPFGLPVKKAPKHILDMSFTAEYMLIWYEELEKDERLLSYAENYAERLLTLQNEKGYFPGWVDEKGSRMGVIDDSPESAMSAVFLLHLGKLTGEERYTKAALKAVEILENEVIPVGRWEDFETYWSCCRWWSDHVGEKIERNNMYKQCSFSMFYMAWALLEAYENTKNPHYLEKGRTVLDELLMLQSSYQPHNMSVPVVGGFGVMNADGELNDARQSLFSELILRYGKILGEEEYIERGKAAVRISFSMMYCPENPEVQVQWEKAWPFLNEKDYGFTMENYGHGGETDENGLGIGEFTIYDWGNGSASENHERILAHFGEDFLKVELQKESPLNGKHLGFLGSSVTYGSANGGISFVEYLCEKHACTYVKEAVSGTTLVDNGPDSYVQRMLQNISPNEKFDLFICQLSTNDANKGLPMGEIASNDSFDTTTVIGAMEFIISYVKKTWNCPVIFYTGTKFDNQQYQDMVDSLYELQKKWGIGIIDLWNGLDIEIPEYERYMADPIHPKEEGYRLWWTPFMEEYLCHDK